ncbi:hypothetical protein LSH36_262g00003 [Paralvinella palmiformis]|uniref:Uncharacterized protein n=1 Tax=Paralvinella palmiformis TaxID=53620 RepID=A0AAD9JLF2_9ANNE|nr:hypothetical protein LSH36_262g00003 [Paralvinella palmiformis]
MDSANNITARSQQKIRDGVDRTRYTPEMDIATTKKCINTNPFVDGRWNTVLDALEAFPTRPATRREVRQRLCSAPTELLSQKLLEGGGLVREAGIPLKVTESPRRLCAECTERCLLFKIKGTLKNHEDVKHSDSDHRQGISAPSFRTAPL